MSNKNPEQTALEELVVDNPDLERLEILIGQFNLFESLDTVRVELRHSAFLSFLLNPTENHGLGDAFLKPMLKRALSSSFHQSFSITPIDLDVWTLDNLNVLREWQGIDILLLDEENKLAVIIENKIDSSEHNDQLQRYWNSVSKHYPGWHTIGIYLSPEGDPSSVDTFIPMDYTTICELLEQMTKTRASSIGPDILVAITHYTQMLRRHIVSESEIAELCRKLYRKHKQALDMIFEYRPDQLAVIRELLERLISDQPDLILDHSSKSYIRFGLKEWDTPTMLQGDGWTRSKRILLFEFLNYPDRLTLHLTIGPGPIDIRQNIFKVAQEHKPPFRPSSRALGKFWNTIYEYHFLNASAYDEVSAEDMEAEIQNKWKQFLDHNLPEILTIFGNAHSFS